MGLILGNKEEFEKAVILTTGQTLNSRYDMYAVDKVFQNVNVLIADEVHYFGANSFFKVSHLFPNAFMRFGFSSTPKGRSDNADIRVVGVFSPEFINVDETLIDRIVPLQIILIKYHQETTKGLQSLDIVNTYDDLLLLESRKQTIISTAQKLSKQDLSWLIFVDRLAYGEELANKLSVPFAHANADRKTIFEDMKQKRIIGCVSTIGKEGLDIPNLDAIINTSIISTPINIIQKSGRVRRKGDGKQVGIVIDLYDESGKALSWTKKRMTIYKKIGNIFVGNL